VLALAAAAGAMALQSAARERAYRELLGRGEAAAAAEQSFGAIEAYSGAIALRPDSMLAHFKRGETYQRRNDLDAATRDFRRAAELDPSATRPLEALGDVLYQRQRFKRASEVYGQRLRLDSESPRVSYKLALARYRVGEIDGAIAALGDALRLFEEFPDAYYLLGLSLREKERLADATAALEKAVALSPGMIAAREELADLYRVAGRRADELEQLQLIAGLDRARTERHVAVGLAHARAGKEELAILTLGQALEGARDQTAVYTALGKVWLDRAVSRHEPVFLQKALEALERGAASADATSETLWLYGRALIMDGQSQAGERALQQATRRFPIEPAALVTYAEAAEREKHLDAARTALIEYGALVFDEVDFGERAARIARLSLALQDAASAIEWYRRALRASPNDLSLTAALAGALLRSGDRAAAEATIVSGLKKDPAHPELLALQQRAR
jgi:tetratricopeptide (TPR) repeat protein